METKEYHLSDIVSITTGRPVSNRHIEGVYDILNFMTGDNLFTHQLGRASKECGPVILEQHPQLKKINSDECSTDNWQEWINGLVEKYGEWLPIAPVGEGQHMKINPVAELESMIGDLSKVVVCEVGEREI